MLYFNYRTKKELINSVGKPLKYTETSIYGNEYVSNGTITGSQPVEQPFWFARVTMKNDLIVKVK